MHHYQGVCSRLIFNQTASKPVVKQLLKKHGYVKRKTQKRLSTGEHRDRNVQFERIAGLKAEYEGTGNPIISVDTKKRADRQSVS